MKPISVVCQELQPIQAPEVWEGAAASPQQPLSKPRGFLGHEAGWVRSVSCTESLRALPR